MKQIDYNTKFTNSKFYLLTRLNIYLTQSCTGSILAFMVIHISINTRLHFILLCCKYLKL